MTPAEFGLAVQAAREEKEEEHFLAAWSAANIMNCWSKKRITPDRLLGRKEKGETSAAEARDHNKARQEKLDKDDEKERAARRWGRA